MNTPDTALSQNYTVARNHHPAWQLLAARRAPLVISCLMPLFEQYPEGVAIETAQQLLADILALHANNDEFEISGDDYPAIARKELRDWIRRSLVVERDGILQATDALQKALRFIESLNDRAMTSTASRLATVQREIENLETRLNPDSQSRAEFLKRKISTLEAELAQVEAGDFEVLTGPRAAEGIREVYTLAASLRADFRRVEDSYRAADRQLRQTIISEENHRGEVIDRLLDSHDNLLNTVEGQVFHGFHEQLNRSTELDAMKTHLRTILANPATEAALTTQQRNEMRWLIPRLIAESKSVIKARARSERDVKGFLKTGLAAEHHRVGQLLNEILETALNIDWGSSAVRKTASSLPPLPVTVSSVPLAERLRFKSIESDNAQQLQLETTETQLDDLDADFWQAFDGLDRAALIQQTSAVLATSDTPMSLAQLAEQLPPDRHDLETLTLWLSIAREAGLPVSEQLESFEISDHSGQRYRFHTPTVALTAASLDSIDQENLG